MFEIAASSAFVQVTVRVAAFVRARAAVVGTWAAAGRSGSLKAVAAALKCAGF